MAWIVGIDEAGYGPNLGPLVMSSVAWHVPDDQPRKNLWDKLRSVVCKHGDDTDGRVIVDDSKLVYTGEGLHGLESSLGAVLALFESSTSLSAHVSRVGSMVCAELAAECWYTGKTALPTSSVNGWAGQRDRFEAACRKKEMRCGPVRSAVICAPRFNQIVARWNSKGVVLAEALGELLRALDGDLADDEPVHISIDKHGGRNTYAPMLQEAFAEGMVVAREEGAERSHYELLGARREVHITFQPRADGEHFCVALASMASKYLRELFMLEFNEFWQRHLPELKPTAGYPGDATRYFEAIRPAMQKLGIDEESIWRCR